MKRRTIYLIYIYLISRLKRQISTEHENYFKVDELSDEFKIIRKIVNRSPIDAKFQLCDWEFPLTKKFMQNFKCGLSFRGVKFIIHDEKIEMCRFNNRYSKRTKKNISKN